MWNRFETAPERYRRQTSSSWHIAKLPSISIDGWLKTAYRPSYRHAM